MTSCWCWRLCRFGCKQTFSAGFGCHGRDGKMGLGFISIWKMANMVQGTQTLRIVSINVCLYISMESSHQLKFCELSLVTLTKQILFLTGVKYMEKYIGHIAEIDFPLTTFSRTHHWFYCSFFCCFGRWSSRQRNSWSFRADFCHCSEGKIGFGQKTWFFLVWDKKDGLRYSHTYYYVSSNKRKTEC